ncbi:MAG: DHHW family protein [Bacillota bacterium]|nr:DHHW family protein [Bacillota bacterium]
MKTKITIPAFIIMLLFLSVLLIFPADKESVLKENREPANLPSPSVQNIFSGKFASGFEKYLSDNIGFRGKMIAVSNNIDKFKGIKSFGYITKANGDLGTGNTVTDKGLLVANDKIMEVFKANPEAKKHYIELINYYAARLPSNIKFYNMIIPTQIEFQKKEYAGLADSQKKTIDSIYSKENSRVISVDAYDVLKEHTNEYIYFRTDHHWTTRGAYYAYVAFCRAAGSTYVNINDFQENKMDGFLGYLYNQAKATELKDKPDTIYYYTNGNNFTTYAKEWKDDGSVRDYKGLVFNIPNPGEEVKYSLFMGGDHPFLYIPTNAKNGKTIVVIKDSYANAFLPWLVNNYEYVLVIDPRSYKGNIQSVLNEYKVTDVLIINYSFSTTFEDIIAAEKEIYK